MVKHRYATIFETTNFIQSEMKLFESTGYRKASGTTPVSKVQLLQLNMDED